MGKKLIKKVMGLVAIVGLASATTAKAEQTQSKNTRFEINAYSEKNFQGSLDKKVSDDFIFGGTASGSDQRLTGLEGRMIKLKPKWYFGMGIGTRQTTPMLLSSKYIKLQAGTRPENNPNFNQMFTLTYIDLPNFFSQEKKIPSNILAFSHSMQNRHKWNLTKKTALNFNMDCVGALFYNPFPSDELVQKMGYNSMWKPWMGDLTTLLLIHYKTNAELMLQRSNFAFGIEEDLDVGVLTIGYHLLKTKINYKYVKLENSFGLRRSDLLSSESGRFLFSEFNSNEYITRSDLVLMPHKNFRFKIHSEYNITIPENNTLILALQGDIGRWTIEPYYHNNKRVDYKMGGINLSFNFGKDNKIINPDDYQKPVYTTLPKVMTPTIGEDTDLSQEIKTKSIHKTYGETIDEAVTKIDNYSDLSEFVSKFVFLFKGLKKETAQEVYANGGGDCRGINRELIPYVVTHSLGYKAEGVSLHSPGTNHAITAVWNEKGTIDIINYTQIYRTGENDIQKAIQKVYPGALIATGTDHTDTVLELRDIVESPLYKPF